MKACPSALMAISIFIALHLAFGMHPTGFSYKCFNSRTVIYQDFIMFDQVKQAGIKAWISACARCYQVL